MPYKLLLADDSVTIQRVIELTFAEEDVHVTAVSDGQQAIDLIQAARPDIVLADVGMPERDGYEVAAFIKNDPALAHIPVLLLTGAFEPIDEERAQRSPLRRRARETVRAAAADQPRQGTAPGRCGPRGPGGCRRARPDEGPTATEPLSAVQALLAAPSAG